MRVRIRHEITQRFEPGSRNLSVNVRLTPRSHEGQFIQRWTLDLNSDCRLHPQEDAFGNLCHAFTVDGPTDHVTVIAEGEVETLDTTGIVRGTVEPFPPSLYLRETDFAHPAPAVIAFAEAVEGPPTDPLAWLHTLMAQLHGAVKEPEEAPPGPPISAQEALAVGTGCSAAITHVFTAAARHVGIPARHISGYLAQADQQGQARHWAEAYVPQIGWIAFDAGRDECATETYVRLAVGLDAYGVAPMRSTGFESQESVSARDGRFQPRILQAQTQGQN